MELFVIGPVSMALGAILLHMSVDHQRKSRMATVTSSSNASSAPRNRRYANVRPASSFSQPKPETGLSATELLLADTLSELLTVREQVASLESKVEAMSTPSTRMPQQMALL